jgi:LAO/AO transport system kinase
MLRRVPRIAISGSPGAGKSTFIESLGMHLVENAGARVAVIAVDPSSTLSHGSILGDKTRMQRLSNHPNAFVRPSPSGGHLGGVTARCWEVMELMAAAQYDVILVETVGIGQSEVTAKYLTDVMVLLVPPASGDELQGIKKGIVEVSDAVVVTKCDGDKQLLAMQTKAAYHQAVQVSSEGETLKPVIACSAATNFHIDKVWEAVLGVWQRKVPQLDRIREAQRQRQFTDYFEVELVRRAREFLEHSGEAAHLLSRIDREELAPREAAEIALHRVLAA